jgi:transcriptional regulator with XRE-family HTH domain
MTTQETFVTRLRRYRERNRISLEELGQETRIRPDLLDALEHNDLSQWPKGLYARAWMLYARAWIRAYATSVGLDPDDTVEEFCRLFPEGDRRMKGTIEELAAIIAHPPEYRDEFGHAGRRAEDQQAAEAETWHEPLTKVARTVKARISAMKVTPSRRAPRTS